MMLETRLELLWELSGDECVHQPTMLLSLLVIITDVSRAAVSHACLRLTVNVLLAMTMLSQI